MGANVTIFRFRTHAFTIAAIFKGCENYLCFDEKKKIPFYAQNIEQVPTIHI